MIHSHTKAEFEKHIYPGCKVIELGDQLMDVGHLSQFQRSDLFYEGKAEIQSIDWHGNNRALKLNLSKPIDQEFQGDIVSNFGTVEHVEDLYNALLNVHNFTKPGGTMIHANPKTGTFAGHGYHFFTQEFWKELAKECKYELIETYERRPYSEENPDIEVFAVFKKLPKSKFVTREEFEVITEGAVFTS